MFDRRDGRCETERGAGVRVVAVTPESRGASTGRNRTESPSTTLSALLTTWHEAWRVERNATRSSAIDRPARTTSTRLPSASPSAFPALMYTELVVRNVTRAVRVDGPTGADGRDTTDGGTGGCLAMEGAAAAESGRGSTRAGGDTRAAGGETGTAGGTGAGGLGRTTTGASPAGRPGAGGDGGAGGGAEVTAELGRPVGTNRAESPTTSAIGRLVISPFIW